MLRYKVMKKIFLLLFILLVSLFYYYPIEARKGPAITDNKSQEEKLCLDFLLKKMTVPNGGIYTGYLDLPSLGVETRGHDILAESEGLMLLYYLKADDQKNFQKHWRFVKENMLLPNNLVGWRMVEGKLSPVSATVDDLRIVKALLLAYTKWRNDEYLDYGLIIGKALKSHSCQGQILVDFFDSQQKAASLNLAYLDLSALSLLSQYDGEWLEIKSNSQSLLSKASFSPQFPLYAKTYNLERKQYSGEKEAEVLYSLMVGLNLAEDGQDVKPLIKWLKKRLISDGAIYARYDIKTQRPSKRMESTAIYALAALLAAQEKDYLLYNKMIKVMKKYQVKNHSSPLDGAFGDAKKMETYSFDNLQALLAFQKGVRHVSKN